MRSTLLILALTIISCGSNNSNCIEGNCENGNGKKVWDDGGIEEGIWVKGELYSNGCQFFGENSEFAGDNYTGEFISHI